MRPQIGNHNNLAGLAKRLSSGSTIRKYSFTPVFVERGVKVEEVDLVPQQRVLRSPEPNQLTDAIPQFSVVRPIRRAVANPLGPTF